jgi:diguanylate cyclase (GGDEF)-like protein/PAS domain S-box-containing protein
MSRILVTLILFLLLTVSQSVEASRYVKLTQFSTENGLKINDIVSMLQDDDGYLWISTNEGLTRFDGYRMSTIASPNNDLANYGAELVWQDSLGTLWFGSNAGNNYALDKGKNSLREIKLTVPSKYKVEHPILTRAIEQEDGNIWFASYGELFYFHRGKNDFQFVLSIEDLFEDPDLEHLIRDLLLVDNYLIIATSKGAYAFNTFTRQTKLINHLPESAQSKDQMNVKSLHLSDGQQVLFGTVSGLYTMQKSQLNLGFEKQAGIELVEDLNIWEIIEKRDFYWLATDQGLYQFKFEGELQPIFKLSDTPFSTSDDDLVTMLEDREGVLWFGTKADGVFKWRPNFAIKKHLWSKGHKQFKLNNDSVYAIHKDQDENLWVGTSNGLTFVNTENWSSQTYLVNSDEKAVGTASSIYDIHENNGKLWLETGAGIKVYDKQTMTPEKVLFPETKEKLFNKHGVSLHFVSEKQLMVVGYEGIYDYDLSRGTIDFIESTANKGNYKNNYFNFFDTFPANPNQRFIAGVDKIYLFSLDTKKSATFHQIKSNKVKDLLPAGIHQEGDNLWVSYPGHGIYQLDYITGKELNFLSEKELGANSVMDIFSDKSGNLWVTSNDGLFRVNKLNLQVTKFDRNDGFASSEFNGGTASSLDSGEALLGSVKGLYLFEPEKSIDKKVFPVKPLITGVNLLSSNISSSLASFNDRTIELNHEDFGLKVEFSAMLLDKPEQVKYFYWIDGDSKIDKIPVGKSELFFPRFSPGKNSIYISAVDYRNGLESEPVKLNIISYPAWWATNLARWSYFLIIISMIGIGVYRHREKLKAKEKVHSKIKNSEERLSLALRGSQSGLWDWHAEDNSVYDPRIPCEQTQPQGGSVPIAQRFLAIHYKDQNSITSKWRDFLRSPTGVFSTTYRMKDSNQTWQWYRDIAMVSEVDSQNNPSRVTGTYTNITEMQKATEKTRLYSSAFENTLDIIIILDRHRQITAGNDALEKISGWSNNEIVGKTLDELLVNDNQRNITNSIFEEIDNSRHWQGEASLNHRNQRKIAVLVSATIFVENDTEQYYVFSISDISKQKEAELELKKLVNYDPLTSLPNRTLLLDRIAHAIPHCVRYQKQLAVFFVDLDRFKQVNDTLGHDAGDQLLIKSAAILRECCREDDTVARIGGDEFVVMLEDVDSVSVINRLLQKILNRMNAPMHLGDNRITISTSIGVSIFPQDAADATTLLKHADIAMYHAKNKGRNNFQYFQDYMNRAAKHRLTLENKIRAGVLNREFTLAYQPLFDIQTGKIRGVEALARWQTSDGEIIPPSSFIPLAEELGLIIPMTENLIRQALDSLTRWNDMGYDVVLAFNISAAHIYHKDFLKFIGALVSEYPQSIKQLELELTESVLMEDIEKARSIFEKIDDFGVELALDDFGTGYSSLKYLSRLPLSKLKIDMSFVQQIGTSFENDAVINTVISLAKSLKLKTVAEGIETQDQFDFLRSADVNIAQGYLFSKPVSSDELETMLDLNIYDSGKVYLND